MIWTFRNELEPRWSYLEAYDAGWLKPKVDEEDKTITQN